MRRERVDPVLNEITLRNRSTHQSDSPAESRLMNTIHGLDPQSATNGLSDSLSAATLTERFVWLQQ